jgi:hypothetical protein
VGFGKEGGAVGLGGAAIVIAALPATIAAADFLRTFRRDAADRLDFIFGLLRFNKRQGLTGTRKAGWSLPSQEPYHDQSPTS